MIRCVLLCIVLLLYGGQKTYAQESNSEKWIAVWDFKMNYVGAFSHHFERWVWTYFNEFKGRMSIDWADSIMTKFESSNSKYYYILGLHDTMELGRYRAEMEKIPKTDLMDKWLNVHSDYQAFTKPSLKGKVKEFLPDGHWILYSSAKGKRGVYVDKVIKDGELDEYFYLADLEGGNCKIYYELKDGLLNGYFVEYRIENKKYIIDKILVYKDGEILKEIFLYKK